MSENNVSDVSQETRIPELSESTLAEVPAGFPAKSGKRDCPACSPAPEIDAGPVRTALPNSSVDTPNRNEPVYASAQGHPTALSFWESLHDDIRRATHHEVRRLVLGALQELQKLSDQES